ncbi:DUF4031 domain-containing protein [Gallaecimonas xiamenensis]|uniref:DUF4031 domain-containing protein n=1 Tax=Gallaecimonas xiamenensis 3-C-1 TaxID=745411 RepID=K2IUG1_9GAMM|nr:DUF4031 domain-containing protein [Gallaecimonas xiamenensis]EKE73936.1 hypothetical protein B3C1_08963 [Gallaecimonas xiamenensis 3-C-1]
MAVYVDNMKAPFRNMVMCHMLADTDEELHAMAALIGMHRRWHQHPGTHKSHYDINLEMRALAVYHGALEITMKEAGRIVWTRRKQGA